MFAFENSAKTHTAIFGTIKLSCMCSVSAGGLNHVDQWVKWLAVIVILLLDTALIC